MAGQTINDRFLAARHSLAGQGLAKSVCKATTEEMIGPKKKHLDYLVHCTNEPNVSIPHLANLLVERSQNANWVVVYKALITTHHVLAYGNERFIQYLASSNSSFQLNNFLDKGNAQGAVGSRVGYDMSPFIRRFAKYLNEKALSYRTVAFDFCKVKRGKEEGSLRTMNADKLLKTLPVLQAQLDALLEFDCTADDLTNGVINMCFMLLFRDLIRLFACYNDGIINLLEKYFDMNKKQCRDALDLYKKFLTRMDRVGEFLKVAEYIGIDKGDIPDLTKAPSSLLDALEQHLASLEGRKGSAASTPTQTASNQKNVKSGVSALSSTSSSFGTAALSTRLDSQSNGVIDENLKAQVLAEEEAAMNQYKSKVSSPTGATNNPFLSSPPSNTNIVDLFGSNDVAGQNASATKASDDLLQLGNPFVDMFGGAPPAANPVPVQGNNMWMTNDFNGTSNVSAVTNNNTFVSDSNFSSVFGNTEPVGSYYLQAAGDNSIPNPFLNDGNDSVVQQHVTGDLFLGGGTNIGGGFDGIARAAPPMRPPPPIPSVSSSPAHNMGVVTAATAPAVVPAQPKSAFDDLNDSIRMALGGSPSKMPIGAMGGGIVSNVEQHQTNIYATQQQQLIQQQQYQEQQMLQQQHQMYPSPAKHVESGGFDALGDVLKPGLINNADGQNQTGNLTSGSQITGVATSQQQQQPSSGKVLTGDLDSSLASLAENLTINKSASSQVKGVQWNSPKNAAKPGSAGWTPQPMAATTGAGYRPMAQGLTVSPAPSTIHHPLVHVPYPVMPAFIQQGIPQMRPMGIRTPMGGVMPMGVAQNVAPQQQPQMMIPQQTPHPPTNSNVQLDPFGAL